MEIKKIAAEDFRCHKKFEIELEKVTLLVGPNGAGKSSILEAPATMLVGENSWCRRDGVSLSDQIRKGAKEAKVSVIGRRILSRIIGPKGSRLVVDKDPLTQPLLLKNLKVTEAQLRATLMPMSFLNLPLKEMKETLFDLLGSAMTLQTVGTYIPKDATVTWEKLCKRWKEDHEGEESVDLDDFYKFVYDARHKYKQKASAPQENPRQKELVQKISEISQGIAAANFDNERRRIGIEQKGKLPEIQARLQAMAAPDVPAFEKKVEELDEEIMDLEKKLSAAEAVLQMSKKDSSSLKDLEVKEGKVRCPLGLECPHDAKAVKSKKDLAKGQELAKAGEIKSLRDRLNLAENAQEKAVQDLKKAREQMDEYDGLIREINQIDQMGEIEEPVDIDALKREKDAVEKELSTLASKPREADPTVDHLNAIVDSLKVDGIKTEVIRSKIAALEKDLNAALAKFGDWRVQFFVASEFRPTILTRGVEIRVGEMSEGERALMSLILQDAFAARARINLVVMDNVDVLDRKAAKTFFETALAVSSRVLVGLANDSFVPSLEGIKIVKLSAPAEAGPKPTPPKDEERPPIEDLL